MNLLIRTDASSKIGTGHLMRCFALAQAWQQYKGQVTFCINEEASVFATRLISHLIQVVYLQSLIGSDEDAQETSKLAYDLKSQWILVDGYHFGAEYQRIIKLYGLRILLIDDYGHAKHYYADIVLNQNISADEALYTNRENYTQLLLGTRYTLLRKEFWQWQGWQRNNTLSANKILITMGGADPDNATLKVMQSLELLSSENLEVVVVVGANNPHYEQLQLTSQKFRFATRIERNVTNMSELMAWADLAITAGGSTCLELAFMGLPSLILILAENQQASAQKLNAEGVAINLGWCQDISAIDIADAFTQLLNSNERRLEMTKCGLGLVDGKGAARVAMLLKSQK